jgi:hypothetical protein
MLMMSAMSDADVAATAAELRDLLELSWPLGQREEANLRRVLVAEYERRRGWKLARATFWADKGIDRWPSVANHTDWFRTRSRRPAAVVAHHDDAKQGRAAVRAWAAKRGLVATFSDLPSWLIPGRTVLVEFTRPKALPAGPATTLGGAAA